VVYASTMPFGNSMVTAAAIEDGVRDAHALVGAEDDLDALLRIALDDQQNRALILTCFAVIELTDTVQHLRDRVTNLEARLREHGLPSD
jgi:hypothetical protein